MDFRSGNFPPGLLNPSAVDSAAGEAATWCKWLFNSECPTWQRFLFNLFFTGHGVWLLLPLSFTILLLYRLVGPPEVITDVFEARHRDFRFHLNGHNLVGSLSSKNYTGAAATFNRVLFSDLIGVSQIRNAGRNQFLHKALSHLGSTTSSFSAPSDDEVDIGFHSLSCLALAHRA